LCPQTLIERTKMLIETAQSILATLTQGQRDTLERSYLRYLAFACVNLDDEYAIQAEADRDTFSHLLKFSENQQPVVSQQRAAEFMTEVCGFPIEWCRAWDACDFYETHGVTLEEAELKGRV
jgi:hypothetical protein